MGRYTGPKERLSRREGVNLFLKGARSHGEKAGVKRRPFPPGQHGNKKRVRLTNYGVQLREKQKVKRIYDIRERVFRNIYLEAVRRTKLSGEDKGLEMLRMIEMRLDNIVYIGGLAPSRSAARQFVNHGHVKVNGKKCNISSLELQIGDIVEVMKGHLVPKEVYIQTPNWITKDGNRAKVLARPVREEIDPGIKESLIVEYYSK